MQRAPQLQWAKFSIMLLTLGAFISILIYVLVARDELTAATVDVPIVRAPETPIKRRPENPGGMEIPNRDRVVFNLLEDTDNNAENTSLEDSSAISENLKVQEEQIKLSLTDIAEEVSEAPETQSETSTPNVTESQSNDNVDVIANLLTESAPKEQKPTPTVIKTNNKPAETNNNQQRTSTSSGKYGVQLASFAQNSDAESAATRYQDKFKSVLNNMSLDIQRADLGTKGIRYRVRFLGLESRTDANNLCKKLKSLGQGCFPTSR